MRSLKGLIQTAFISAILLGGLAAGARADFIRAYAWITTTANEDLAAPSTFTKNNCHRGVEPCTRTNYDLTFTTEGIDFSLPPNTTLTLGKFVNSSGFPVHDKAYQNGASDTTGFHTMIMEFVGEGRFTGTLAQPQSFTIQHDDGVTFTVNAQVVVDKPDRTSPIVTTKNYTGGAGNRLPFQLVYVECCNAPVVLKTSLLGPLADPDRMLTRIDVLPNPAAAELGGNVPFSAQAYDQNNVPMNGLSYAWSVGNAANTVNSAGLFTGNAAGNDTVTAAIGAVHGNATVAVGDGNGTAQLARIVISPQNPSVALDGQVQFSAQGYDQNNNPVNGISYGWARGNLTNSMTSTGLFTGKTSGVDTVTVSHGVIQAATSVTVLAPAVLTSIIVTPLAAYRHPGETISFTAQGYDQNNLAIPGLSYAWSLPQNNSGATIGAAGLYTAGNAALPANDIVRAASGGIAGSATVQVDNPGQPLTINSVTADPNPLYGVSTHLHVDAVGPSGDALTYLWSRVSGPAGVDFNPPNNKDATATFSAPGVYVLQAKVTSSSGLFLTGSVSVQVIRTVSRIQVYPERSAIRIGERFTFGKHVYDQWNVEMVNEAVNWSASAGSISPAAGDFYSPIARLVTITATSVSRPIITGRATLDVQGAGASEDFDISEAYAYPVPWKSTMPVPFITFAGLAQGTDIRIFDMPGRLVRKISSVNGEDKQWYIDNDNGERVASGVYFYIIENGTSGQEVKGKVVVIK